jgi:hypothetical protein
MANETGICRLLPKLVFTEDRKSDRSSVEQHLSMLVFTELEGQAIFCRHNILTEGVLVTKLYSDVGI